MGCDLINTSQDLQQIKESLAQLREAAVRSLTAFSPVVYQKAFESELGRLYAETGVQVQGLVAGAVAQAISARPDPTFAAAMHGVDARLVSGDTKIIVEVKTSWDKDAKSFTSSLDKGTGQASDSWLAKQGEDPSQSVVLGAFYDRSSETFDLYLRTDSDAEEWVKVLEDVDLGP